MDKKQKGAGIILSVVLLFVILAMVVTLASVTVLETKMSQKTKSSIGAFYNSESGVEWALNQISTNSGSDIITAFPEFSVTDKKVLCPTGRDCEIYLLDDQGKVIGIGTTAISLVKAVRSVGTQNISGAPDTQMEVEATVPPQSMLNCMNGIVNSITTYNAYTQQWTIPTLGLSGTTGWKTSAALPSAIPSTANAVFFKATATRLGKAAMTDISVWIRKDSTSTPIKVLYMNYTGVSSLTFSGSELLPLSSARTFDYKVDYDCSYATSGGNSLTVKIDVLGYME